jgi:hypothetical protein
MLPICTEPQTSKEIICFIITSALVIIIIIVGNIIIYIFIIIIVIVVAAADGDDDAFFSRNGNTHQTRITVTVTITVTVSQSRSRKTAHSICIDLVCTALCGAGNEASLFPVNPARCILSLKDTFSTLHC